MARWKEINGYEGKYIISDYGKIINILSLSEMKPFTTSTGYKRIQLSQNGIRKKHFLHRLVADAFIPNPNNHPIINHKDENPSNNNYLNLEWCSYQYNATYGNAITKRVAHTDYKNRKTRDIATYKRGVDSCASKHVYQFDLCGNLIGEYNCCVDAAKVNNFDSVSIGKACNGRLIIYKGFKWQYTEVFEAPRSKTLNTNLPVLQFDTNGNLVRRYEYATKAKEYGFDPSCIAKVCNGKLKIHKGYIWKHEESE